ncbi:MAG TPA: nucleotide exchange factor GrpE [Candidatus Binatia bacterium]|jgi:molecular chaperone GrpE
MEEAGKKPANHESRTEYESGDFNAVGEVERLREELRREHDKLVRALADFDNYRRRVERERASAARSGKREMILRLLDVLDDFDRALGQVEGAAASAFVTGVQVLHRKLLGVLESEGIEAMESLGASFDPRYHDAIGTVESDELEPGAIAEELQRGYRWGDDVIRPARVRVAQ